VEEGFDMEESEQAEKPRSQQLNEELDEELDEQSLDQAAGGFGQSKLGPVGP
jgi:hypothetical protein